MDIITYNKVSNLEEELKYIQTPTGFKWTDHPLKGHLFRTESGIFCDFDVSQFKPTGKTYWVDPNGSDSNSGEDAEHPLQFIKTAMNKSDVAVVVLKDGIYNYPRCPQHLNGYSKSIAVIAAEGASPVIVSEEGAPSFTKTDGYTYVYQTSQKSSAVYDVINKKPYKPVYSVAEVEAEEGTFYTTDTPSSVTYLHMINGETPGYSKVKCCKTYDVFRITASGEITVYIEGLTICGGGYGGFRVTSDGINRPKVYAKNCKFYGSMFNSAMYLEGCESIVQNCYAAFSFDDGFGYHAKTREPISIEIGCVGYGNGYEGDTDNGSTMHDGGAVIRVNGNYYGNKGPNVADVHNTTASWNIGCHAWKSESSAQDSQNSDFVASDNAVNMWLDSCSGYGSTHSLLANGTGTVRVRNCAFPTIKVGTDCHFETY